MGYFACQLGSDLGATQIDFFLPRMPCLGLNILAMSSYYAHPHCALFAVWFRPCRATMRMVHRSGLEFPGSEKGVVWKKGSFQRSPFSREFRDSRELPDSGKQRRIQPSFLEILET